nr:CHAT domain-containing protein [Kitasatospora sp. SID7827]
MPDDLRRRALTALAAAPGGPGGSGPATPPSVAEVGAALRAAGADALAYLLPPGGGRNGEAVLVTADGRVELQPLTLVRAGSLGTVTAYRDAHRARQATLALPGRHPERRAARHRWRAALAELCDWAGIAVVRPLLRHPALRPGGGAPPRLVLVPFGEFGRVPWHAGLLRSGLRDGSRPVRVAERVVLSYAASARQFCQTVARERLPLDRHPVIVGDPARNLPGAEIEAEYLHADHYPDGTLLGYVLGARGPGTPAEVLAALPAPGRAGASVLHLACHARPLGRSPLEAHLELAPVPGGPPDSGRLPVADILRQAQGRPPSAPGGLVVLDACVSDHSDDDLDEALTLSTAFLAAGATGVIGSRWEVQDDQVGLLMYVLHGRLRLGEPPAEALRATQLWALDPDRRLPPGVPDELADAATGLDALEAWAAFGYQGS